MYDWLIERTLGPRSLRRGGPQPGSRNTRQFANAFMPKQDLPGKRKGPSLSRTRGHGEDDNLSPNTPSIRFDMLVRLQYFRLITLSIWQRTNTGGLRFRRRVLANQRLGRFAPIRNRRLGDGQCYGVTNAPMVRPPPTMSVYQRYQGTNQRSLGSKTAQPRRHSYSGKKRRAAGAIADIYEVRTWVPSRKR